ncbi:MAG: hypothetical protein V3R84_09475 [Acidimicrobiia bacterium]
MRAIAAVALVALVACGGSDKAVEGRLAEVDSDLLVVRSFALLTDDGERLEFKVEAGATFHGGPIAHIRDHLLSGESVVVFYEERGGDLVATGVEDS